ncbi:MAG TPA: four helix bundle protein [Planctomycetota bacterium]|nr:four helix bundle protein [Planctomycetota bacterium]
MSGQGEEKKRTGDRSGEYNLEERLLAYATRIVRVVESLPNTKAGNHVASQLLRAGTSPLSNHGEAQSAESRSDFVHKLSICLKELRETQRWLYLAQRVPLVKPPSKLDELVAETDALVRIFASSIQTAHHHGRRPQGGTPGKDSSEAG